MIAGTVIESPQKGLWFRCGDGENTFDCAITESGLEEIIQLHRLDVHKDESFETIVIEIEQVINQKRNAGRLEPNGSIVARTIDILRYGTIADAAVHKSDFGEPIRSSLEEG
jgi:hypothetical protein